MEERQVLYLTLSLKIFSCVRAVSPLLRNAPFSAEFAASHYPDTNSYREEGILRELAFLRDARRDLEGFLRR